MRKPSLWGCWLKKEHYNIRNFLLLLPPPPRRRAPVESYFAGANQKPQKTSCSNFAIWIFEDWVSFFKLILLSLHLPRSPGVWGAAFCLCLCLCLCLCHLQFEEQFFVLVFLQPAFFLQVVLPVLVNLGKSNQSLNFVLVSFRFWFLSSIHINIRV